MTWLKSASIGTGGEYPRLFSVFTGPGTSVEGTEIRLCVTETEWGTNGPVKEAGGGERVVEGGGGGFALDWCGTQVQGNNALCSRALFRGYWTVTD